MGVQESLSEPLIPWQMFQCLAVKYMSMLPPAAAISYTIEADQYEAVNIGWRPILTAAGLHLRNPIHATGCLNLLLLAIFAQTCQSPLVVTVGAWGG